jgi:hypothetical protein
MIYDANNHKMHQWTGSQLEQRFNEDNDESGIWWHCCVAE